VGRNGRPDKERRSVAQQAAVLTRLSEETKARLMALARRERRTLSGQAAIFIEEGLARAEGRAGA